jgi:hypothetical protein
MKTFIGAPLQSIVGDDVGSPLIYLFDDQSADSSRRPLRKIEPKARYF